MRERFKKFSSVRFIVVFINFDVSRIVLIEDLNFSCLQL